MGVFKKKRNEIIDFSDMYKRGWIKAADNDYDDSPEIIDLTQPISNSAIKTNSVSKNDNFDFLTGFAQASASAPDNNSVVDSLRTARRESGDHLRTEMNELKIKLDDANYKIETLIAKIRELERKIN